MLSTRGIDVTRETMQDWDELVPITKRISRRKRVIDWKFINIPVEPDAEIPLNDYFQQIKSVLDTSRITLPKQQEIFTDLKEHVQDYLENNMVEVVTVSVVLELQEHLGKPSEYADYADKGTPEIKFFLDQSRRETGPVSGDQAIRCNNCGVLNESDSLFCLSCGAKIREARVIHRKSRSVTHKPSILLLITIYFFQLTYFLTYVTFFSPDVAIAPPGLGIVFFGSIFLIPIVSLLVAIWNFSERNANPSNYLLSGSVAMVCGIYNLINSAGSIFGGQDFIIYLPPIERIILSLIMLFYPLPVAGVYLFLKKRLSLEVRFSRPTRPFQLVLIFLNVVLVLMGVLLIYAIIVFVFVLVTWIQTGIWFIILITGGLYTIQALSAKKN
ncbi:MAG: hypothetical protein ACXADA_06025 [Candidatus Hodarchaeales archaeon]|jgi:hypothetical protein